MSGETIEARIWTSGLSKGEGTPQKSEVLVDLDQARTPLGMKWGASLVRARGNQHTAPGTGRKAHSRGIRTAEIVLQAP